MYSLEGNNTQTKKKQPERHQDEGATETKQRDNVSFVSGMKEK